MSPDFFPAGVHLTKRLFDLFCSIPGLILLSPFMLLVAVLILIFDGWPVIFLQERPGFTSQIIQNDQVPHHDDHRGIGLAQ